MNLGQENEYQEFKESLSQLDKGLKSITAMLNRHGKASVYFGVDDSGNVCGLDVGINTLMDIRNRIADKIEPRIYTEITSLQDESGKDYIKVTATGSDIPYSFDGRYYIRNVSADEQATNEVLRKMLASSDSDIIRQKASPNQELKFSTMFAVLSANGIHPKDTSEFYASYGLLNRDGKFNMNAYLLSDCNELALKVVVFAGDDKTIMSKRTDYGNRSLLTSINEVLNFFESLNETNVDLSGITRKEKNLFDFASFREAWINACLHNDWNNAIPPSVFLFDNRIEIVSYGGIPYSLTKEGFFNGTSVPVNKSLLSIFIAARLAEQSGHGIPTIVEQYGREAFSFDDGMLKVTIPLSFDRTEVVVRKNKVSKKKGLNNNQKKVLEILTNDGSLSLQDVADMSDLSIGGIKKICHKLQEFGFLERIGSKRDGCWITK